MAATICAQLRRALALRGLTPASAVPEASGGRSEEACIRPATLVEDAALAWHAPGRRPSRGRGRSRFSTASQRSELVAYAGSAPIVVGEVAAAVRERPDRRLATVLEARAVLLIARPEAIAAAGERARWPAHRRPAGGRAAASGARPGQCCASARSCPRRARASSWASATGGGPTEWLVVDGALTESPRLGRRSAHAGRVQEPRYPAVRR